MANDADDSSPARFPRWLTWSLFGALAVVVLGYGGILLYANVLNDGPEAFDESDLDAVLDSATGTPPTAVPTVAPASSTPATSTPATSTPATSTPATSTPAPAGEQAWTITEGSEVGYRVAEILFGVDTEAVGRTGQVTGGIVIDGTRVTSADFEVDVASIASDDSRRDNQFRGRIMSADEFPTATFVLTEPIELGAAPGDGVEVTATATGELTLRGVTRPVTFELTAKQDAGRIGILGSIPVVFADHQIANPSFGGITTEDQGLLEFVLVLAPA